MTTQSHFGSPENGWTSDQDLSSLVSHLAHKEGFVLAGIAPLTTPASDSVSTHFTDFIQEGRAGEMEYLKRQDETGQLLRSKPQLPFPWARSIIVCAASYNSSSLRSVDPAPPGAGWIARYAWSSRPAGQQGGPGKPPRVPSDYHKVLLKRLKRMEAALHLELGIFESRSFVDTGPVIERAWAHMAGIGWTGKNTCLINQEKGSWLLLGIILTSLEPQSDRLPLLPSNRCGTCTRCIDACPTNALTEPYRLDARLCISYLTIEKRGDIEEELRSQMGRQIFGCDICQDVCPWNRKAPQVHDDDMAPRAELMNPSLDWLAGLTESQFEAMFNGSPVRRTGFLGFRRNLAIAMANSGLKRYGAVLEEWAEEGNGVVRSTAMWALNKLRAL